MTLHVCVLGIDGSGKSTITAALPAILAAEMNLIAGSAGEAFCIIGPDGDQLSPKFYPKGLPVSGRLSIWFQHAAKRMVDNRRLYPFVKLAHMLFQDCAAADLSRRFDAHVMVSDGNALLSTTARAANYLRPASDGAQAETPTPEAEDLKAVFSYILDGQPVPVESARKLPRLEKGKVIYSLTRLLRLRTAWLPDVVIFLDLSPTITIRRIAGRRQKIDRHENVADLAQAREMYLKTIKAFQQYRSPDAAHAICIDDLSVGETIGAVVEALRPHLLVQQEKSAASKTPLGTTTLSGRAFQGKAFNPRYITHYLLAKCFRGAWREPTFFFSNLGKLFLQEGYSAGVMRVIYDQDEKQYGLLDRIFLEDPLHRAVYDRLHILTKKIELELHARLSFGREVRIFTAPSGFAYDLFRPLEAIAERHPEWMRRVHVVAADLDAHNVLADELMTRAERLGIQFTFFRGDITSDEMRRKFEETAPYDIALFVGLSSWLPKPQIIRHLRWVRDNLREDGLLVTDSFTPEAYALSGWYVGYQAHYYTPEVYKALMGYCGFDGLNAEVESGRDAINHVLLASPQVRYNDVAPSSERAGYVFTDRR